MAKLSDPVPGSYRLWSREAQMARRHISHATYGHERSPLVAAPDPAKTIQKFVAVGNISHVLAPLCTKS